MVKAIVYYRPVNPNLHILLSKMMQIRLYRSVQERSFLMFQLSQTDMSHVWSVVTLSFKKFPYLKMFSLLLVVLLSMNFQMFSWFQRMIHIAWYVTIPSNDNYNSNKRYWNCTRIFNNKNFLTVNVFFIIIFIFWIIFSSVHSNRCYSWTWSKFALWQFQSDQQTRTLSEFSISRSCPTNFWAPKSCSWIQQFTSIVFFEWNKHSRQKIMGDENFNWSRWKIRFERIHLSYPLISMMVHKW